MEHNPFASQTQKAVHEATQQLSVSVSQVESEIEKTVSPVRHEFLKKFPVPFLLLVTAGLTATMNGLERLLLELPILQNHPSIMLIIGLILLTITGTLYKKLG